MNPIPRYASLSTQVAREIRKKLRSEYVSGGRLPSEPELAEQFGVSRGTVRQALTILEREGAIFRRHGSGTFVNKYVLRIQARAEYAHEHSDLLRLANYEAAIIPLGVTHRSLPADIGELMDIFAPDTPALEVRKLFQADGQPAIYCLDYIPAHLVCIPYDDKELQEPVFHFLKRHCNLSIGFSLAEIIPVVADEELAGLLSMNPGEPLLRFDEVNHADSGPPAFFSRSYFKDEFIRFTMLRKRVW